MQSEPTEEWRDVVGFEGMYEVSSNGKIRNLKTGKLQPINFMGSGYVKADLKKEGVRHQTSVHRVVATCFIENPECHKEVNHKNGIKTDNRVENLEWSTRSNNVNHSYYKLKNLVRPVTAKCIETGKELKFSSINEASRCGFSSRHIHDVMSGKRKHHLGYIFSDSE